MIRCEMENGLVIIDDSSIDEKEDCPLYEDGLCNANDYKICIGKP